MRDVPLDYSRSCRSKGAAFWTDCEAFKANYGAVGRNTVRFAPEYLSPVNGFRSMKMYELPSSLLSASSLNRYLFNSPILPQFKGDADGGLMLLRLIQGTAVLYVRYLPLQFLPGMQMLAILTRSIALCAVGISIYLAVARILGISELAKLQRLLSRKLMRSR